MMCGKEFPVALAMIQPEPFPGSFRHDGMPFEEIVAVSLKEIEMIQDNGFDGYIIQNRNDAPVRQQALPETVAYMTALAMECRRRYPGYDTGDSGQLGWRSFVGSGSCGSLRFYTGGAHLYRSGSWVCRYARSTVRGHLPV